MLTYWWIYMSFESNSPNMGLVIPGVGLTSGPQYASDLNASLSIIDQHNHTPGNGVQITPTGLNINADLTFNSNDAIAVRTVRFTPQSSLIPGSSPDLGCIYESGVDLYYNDGNGNQVRLTSGGSVAGTTGSISGLVAPASASYVVDTFVWQSDANKPANMDAASYIFRNFVANSKGLTVQPPNAMGADYSITLPSLPASQKIMTLDNSGIMSAPYTVDNSTITIAANVIGVPNLGIGTAQIANAAVTTAKLPANYVQNSITSQTFTSNGNFTVPAGVTTIFVSGSGGGGGGGGGNTTTGAGGGGEGAPYYSRIPITVSPAAVLPVVIGGGGSAGAGSGGGPTSGGNGGDSTISGLTFRGGVGGINGASTGLGGVSKGGNPSHGAGGGDGGTGGSNGQAGGSSMLAAGGSGGASAGSGGGGGGASSGAGGGGGSGGPGNSGSNYGGGGGGSAGGGGGASAAGGVGATGIIIVYWNAY